MEEQELDRIYSEIAPYLSNHPRIRLFLNKKRKLKRESIVRILDERIAEKDGPLKTDYKILRNKLLEDNRE